MKKIFLLLIASLLLSFNVNKIHNYQCNYCELIISKSGFPSTNGCSKHPSHYWHDLGEVGFDNYSCVYCGSLAKSAHFPYTSGCQSKSSHHWIKL